MNQFDFLTWQFRGLVLITLGYPLLLAGCRVFQIESSRVRYAAVLTLLLAAVCPWSLRCDVPWYSAEETPTQVSTTGSDVDVVPSTDRTDWFATADSPLLVNAGKPLSGIPSSATHKSPFASLTLPTIQSWRAILIATWCTVLLSLLSLACWRYFRVLAAARRGLPIDQAWLNEWRELLRDRRIIPNLPLIATQTIGPMLGLLPRGYALLIPADFWRSLEPRQRLAILRHELAHYQRGDIVATFALRFLAMPFAWHPFTWRLVALFEEAAEWDCDQAACRRNDRVYYAQALQQLLVSNVPAMSLALGRCAQSHPLVLRVRRILNPSPHKETTMKTTLFTAVIAVAALLSLLQIRLTAQDKTEATIETVKAQMETLKSKLEDLKGAAEQTKDDSKQLEERVKNHLDRLKELVSEPSKLPLDIQRRIELLKADEEEKQLQALDGADKLGDEGLLLCGFAAKEIGRDSVREKALAIAAAKGEEGLPVIVFAVGSLTADNRTFLLKELVKNKEKVAPLVFARFAKDDVAANRELALKTGLSIAKNPLIFLALAADGNESNADSLFAAGSTLQGDDLQLFLFAVAVKGPEELLVTTVQKAVALKTDGYPIIAAAYKRDVAAVRGEIVRQYRKSTIPVEQFVVREALKDGDETLRSAAEKANQEP